MNQSATYNISSIEWYAQMACVIQVPITFSGFVSNILLIIAHSKDPLKTLKVSSSLFIINIAFIDVILSFVYLIWSLLTIVSSEYRPILKEGITATVIDTFMEMCYPSFMCLSIERFVPSPFLYGIEYDSRQEYVATGSVQRGCSISSSKHCFEHFLTYKKN